MVDDASIGRGDIYLSILLVLFILFIEYLKDTLEAFTKELPVTVRILRNDKRLGLMKSRLKGK
jgi:hypothetical protein